jgi:peptidyl-dipeptidase A
LKVENLSAVDLVGQKQLGEFMKERVFSPGKLLRWDKLLIEATGETLNPKYFAEQFVK